MINGDIQLALIGCGGQGQGDLADAVRNPQVKVVAGCDIYGGRLERMRELYGKDVYCTREYREILDRKDVDAVIIATPDHWHARISVDALNAGKDVYCEKPMVQKIDEGRQVVEASRKNPERIFQVGSQYASAISFRKIGELLKQGAIGELNLVEAWLDRNTAVGAWQYSIPLDANPETVDWYRFLGNAPRRPFEPVRLFRWRNYQDYGTAVAGDLFVHLFTGLHTATGSLGPQRIFSTGGLRYWKDGRDVPDMMLATIEYPKTDTHPAFTFVMRVNFKSSKPAEDFGFRFVGSQGTITTDVRSVTISRQPRETEPGYTIGTFSKAMQEQFLREYRKQYPVQKATTEALRPARQEVLTSPPGFDAHQTHMRTWLEALRSRKPVFEDAVFGLRAAGPALLCNTSYYESRVCQWDPVTMSAS
jgi:predicted dehydrogenase